MQVGTHARAVEVPDSTLVAPILSYLPRKDLWLLVEPYVYRDGDTELFIPAGFEFDLSTVPKVFWPLIAPFKLSIVAPLVHDFLYRYGGFVEFATEPPKPYDRMEADRLFRAIMEQEGVAAWRRRLAWAGVRTFGGFVWESRRA